MTTPLKRPLFRENNAEDGVTPYGWAILAEVSNLLELETRTRLKCLNG